MNVPIVEIQTQRRRPRLLFVARPFPPARATACNRTWNIAKYLARLGWEVTVVTPHPSAWREVDNPDEVASKLEKEEIRRILTSYPWKVLKPGPMNCWNTGVSWLAGAMCRKVFWQLGIERDIGWIKGVGQACAGLSKGDVDVILATGSPFASFKLAKQLSDRLDCPYVLDYRDPWTENPHNTRAISSKIVREELRLLAGSAAVTIVSPSWAEALDRRFNVGPKLHVVSNGYDPETLAGVSAHDFGHFAIVYAGNFYSPKRVISPVMDALSRITETEKGAGTEWFFHYYGRMANHVMQEATRFGLSEKVAIHGWVPQTEALSAVRGAGLVVVITSIDDDSTIEERGIMTGKIYETIGLRVPVLLIAPKGSDLALVVQQTASVRAFSGGSVEDMAIFIKQLMSDQVPGTEPHDTLAWPNIARGLDSILRRAISSKLDSRGLTCFAGRA